MAVTINGQGWRSRLMSSVASSVAHFAALSQFLFLDRQTTWTKCWRPNSVASSIARYRRTHFLRVKQVISHFLFHPSFLTLPLPNRHSSQILLPLFLQTHTHSSSNISLAIDRHHPFSLANPLATLHLTHTCMHTCTLEHTRPHKELKFTPSPSFWILQKLTLSYVILAILTLNWWLLMIFRHR